VESDPSDAKGPWFPWYAEKAAIVTALLFVVELLREHWSHSIILLAASLILYLASFLSKGRPGTGRGRVPYGIEKILLSDGKALSEFEGWIGEETEKNAQYYLNRGLSLAETGNHQQAFREFTTAINLKPDYAEAYQGLGMIFYKSHMYYLAIEAFKKAILLLSEADRFRHPENARANYHLGRSFYELGMYRDANAVFALTSSIEPENAEAHYYLGMCYEHLGEDEQCIHSIRTSAKLGHKQAQIFMRSQPHYP
jgi:tetratricopeptide (TPR) repeat protein